MVCPLVAVTMALTTQVSVTLLKKRSTRFKRLTQNVPQKARILVLFISSIQIENFCNENVIHKTYNPNETRIIKDHIFSW